MMVKFAIAKLTILKKFAFFLMGMAILLACCTKEGQVGHQGETGPVGPAGADGSVIGSGTATPPPAATGKNGDYYFNSSTRMLYGFKGTTGWGSGISLQGDQGIQGVAGSKILSGSEDPAASLGELGDYFL